MRREKAAVVTFGRRDDQYLSRVTVVVYGVSPSRCYGLAVEEACQRLGYEFEADFEFDYFMLQCVPGERRKLSFFEWLRS